MSAVSLLLSSFPSYDFKDGDAFPLEYELINANSPFKMRNSVKQSNPGAVYPSVHPSPHEVRLPGPWSVSTGSVPVSHSQDQLLYNSGFRRRINSVTIYFKGIRLELAALHLKSPRD